MIYTIVETATGRLVGTVNCPDNMLALQFNAQTHFAVEGHFPDDEFYFDGGFLPMPPRPSAHHRFDYTVKQWLDPRTLQDLKDAKWAAVKVWRAAATVAPLMQTRFGIFDAKPGDVENVKDTLAGLNAADALGIAVEPIRWTMADENAEKYVTLTLNELREVAVLLLARGNEAHVRSRALFDQIEAATSAEELANVILPVPH